VLDHDQRHGRVGEKFQQLRAGVVETGADLLDDGANLPALRGAVRRDAIGLSARLPLVSLAETRAYIATLVVSMEADEIGWIASGSWTRMVPVGSWRPGINPSRNQRQAVR
jgi:hypothetical protein